MVHEIDMSNSRANVAWTGSRDAVWHKLGTQIPDNTPIETWTKEAGLDWEALEAPVCYQTYDGIQTFPDKKVLFRSDTKESLSVVGKDYHIVQPKEIMEFYRDLVQFNGFKLSSAGSLFGGRRFWCLAETGKTFTVNANDTTNGYLLLVTSLDGTISTQARFTSIRVVCNNLLSIAMSEDQKTVVRKTHASAFDPKAFKLDLGLIDQSWETFSSNIKKLTEVEVTDQFATGYFQKKFFNPEVSADEQTTQTYNKVSKVLDLYKNGAGADMSPNSAYAILQALTNAGTHGLRNKQDESKKFWESSFGSWDKMKNDCYNDMLAMAA